MSNIPISPAAQRAIDEIWSQYGDLTRFHRSTRIAAVREADIWESVRAHTDPAQLQIVASPTGSRTTYTVSLDDHLTALESTATLSGLVLVRSWSLAESLGRIALQLRPDAILPQVEQWAPQALATNY